MAQEMLQIIPYSFFSGAGCRPFRNFSGAGCRPFRNYYRKVVAHFRIMETILAHPPVSRSV